ncbi:rhodanese-like domain-containing protein [Uliginosibacterium sediminicola]|uniref:Rhodanese-like domain-containing protein n=1 Tax=Uliginosibacterium sediminicola TaxID=2024550 RepID=A0ABU9Z2T5_9RHOO
MAAVSQLPAADLAAWLQDAGRPQPVLLDVREPHEFAYCAIAGSQLMPMGTVPSDIDKLDPEAEIVCICHHGMRSLQVAMFLSSRGFDKVFNLSGGVHAWAQQVDPQMPTY